ncbi:MAG: DUF1801 domain-containing protein [Flavobacterium sp.]|nr:DUF1801 domain-containing protein [Flavobacterium sp.]
MQSIAKKPLEYIESLSEDRKEAILKIRSAIFQNLPKGFEEVMNYGMLGYVVPHSIYPNGYHCDPKLPLPFMGLASQKNNISFYHMGIYAEPQLLDWFISEYPKHVKSKLDMGKSCIRFKKMNEIPFALIGELVGKLTPEKWIELYESTFRK